MKKIRTIVINALAAAVITIAALFVLTCGDPAPAPSAQKFTLAFDTDGGTAIPSVTAAAGEAIEFPEDPVKDGYNFVGWFDSPERTGEPVELPSVMPEGGGTYYAKFEPKPPTATYTVRYEYNLGGTPSASILPSTVEVGQPVTVKDGKGFGTRAHRFVGWTDSRGGVVAVTGEKNGGQYMPGETFVPTSNMTLYAQWAREYEDARGSDDKIYVYAPLIGKGLGAADRKSVV